MFVDALASDIVKSTLIVYIDGTILASRQAISYRACLSLCLILIFRLWVGHETTLTSQQVRLVRVNTLLSLLHLNPAV